MSIDKFFREFLHKIFNFLYEMNDKFGFLTFLYTN
jgi:hypothetical protein